MTVSQHGNELCFPDFISKNTSLLKKYLTPGIFDSLKEKETENGFNLSRLIRSGVENQDSSIGVYAGDEETYKTFASLLLPVIYDYHGYSEQGVHPRDFSPFANELERLDPENNYIKSTRIRVGRNLAGFPLGPLISGNDRYRVEAQVSDVLNSFSGDLAGEYFSIETMRKDERKKLIDAHLLFKEGDRFLESAGLNRDWPKGRGIFLNNDKSFLVWVNEEDQLRIISMESGGDLERVFNRLARAVSLLEKRCAFLFNKHLGYLASCPTNLGTAMRASVHIHLPALMGDSRLFKDVAERLNLQIRGIHGEHSESQGGIFDVSNKHRLGISEKSCVRELHQGISELIHLEKKMR